MRSPLTASRWAPAWLCLLFSLLGSPATADYWSRTYEHPDRELVREAFLLAPGPDCGWALAGKAGRSITPRDRVLDAMVLKIDAEGDLLWATAFGGDGKEKERGIVAVEDGGYVVLYDSSSFIGQEPGLFDAPWFVKLDATGAIEWQVSYEFWNVAAIAGPTPRGGVMFLGALSRDLWLIELGPNGEEIRQRKLVGAPDSEVGFDLVRTRDGGFLVAGGTSSFGAGRTDLWLIKLDAAGEIAWQRAYGGPDEEWIPRAWQTADGGYLLGGVVVADPDDSTIVDTVVFRLDAEGDVLWVRRYDSLNDEERREFDGVVETADGGVLVAHVTGSPTDPGDVRLLRLSPDGDPLWVRGYEFDFGEQVLSLLPLSDGGAVVGSSMRNLGPDGNPSTPGQGWIMRLDPDGLIGGGGCGLEQDMQVAEIPYAPQVTDTDAWFEATDIGRFDTDVVAWQPEIVVYEQCRAPACLAPRCGPALADPYLLCEGEELSLDLLAACGEGPVSVGWDLDGDGTPDAQGQSVRATLPAGTHEVTATVTDSCPDPGPGTCRSRVEVRVLSGAPPGEVSGPAEPRLRVTRRDDGVVALALESAPEAAAYNLYADRIGSWYAPTEAKGSACGLTQWTDLGNGAVELEHVLPTGSWIVATASTPCAEGPAGPDSAGTERTTRGTWQRCGPAP